MPDYAEAADFGPSDRLAWSLQIAGYWRSRLPHHHLTPFGSMSRIASDGIAGLLTPHTDPPGGLHHIGTRSGWEILQALAGHVGYTAVIALHEPIRLMREIDQVIDAHGGWPDALVAPNTLRGPSGSTCG